MTDSGGPGGGGGIGVVAARLRARQGEIVQAIFARVRQAVVDPVAERDAEYLVGLRATVAAAVEYGLEGLERGEDWRSVPVPQRALVQVQRAARIGVSQEAVLQRYIVGHALLWDCVMEEADRARPEGGALRAMSRAQSGLLERLTAAVSLEYGRERERAGRSSERRLLDVVRGLLAGERTRAQGLGYDLEGEHVGVVVHCAEAGAEHGRAPARGAGAGEAGVVEVLREAAGALDRQLLCVATGEETVWGWLGGKRALRMADLQGAVGAQMRRLEGRPGVTGGRIGDRQGVGEGEQALAGGSSGGGLLTNGSSRDGLLGGAWIAAGEPAWGLQGFRLTHQQAQAAALVAARRPRAPTRGVTRYGDVALLAAALKDEGLARALVEIYVAPLEDDHGGGRALRETLRAYVTAECSVSSAAAALGVVRRTVQNRLHTIEDRLGRPLHPCPPEIEVALQLDEMGVAAEATSAAASVLIY